MTAQHFPTPMHEALALAAQSVGLTEPNPRVGCVIVAPDVADVTRPAERDSPIQREIAHFSCSLKWAVGPAMSLFCLLPSSGKPA